MAEGTSRLNANGREALRAIARADESYTGGETWDERNYPGTGRIQYVHWRTAKALVARDLITSTFAYQDEDDNRVYNVYRLALTETGQAVLTPARPAVVQPAQPDAAQLAWEDNRSRGFDCEPCRGTGRVPLLGMPDGSDAVRTCLDCNGSGRAPQPAQPDDDWQPGRWWLVQAPDGSTWCSTSDEAEARAAVRPGDLLTREYVRSSVSRQWREVEP